MRLVRSLAAPDFWLPLTIAGSLGATAFLLAGGSDPWGRGTGSLVGTAAGMVGLMVGLWICDRARRVA
jgi:hypothetical protein